MQVVKRAMLRGRWFRALNARLKARRLAGYYTSLREYYLGLDDVDGVSLLRQLIAKYNIRLAYPGPLRTLFYCDPRDWVYEHLMPLFSSLGAATLLTYNDGPIEQVMRERKSNGEKLLEHLRGDSNYDLVFIGGARGHIPCDSLIEVMAKWHIPVVNFQFDDKQAFVRTVGGVEMGSLEAARGSLLTFTNAKYSVDWYLKEGCPALYAPEGSSPALYFPDPLVEKKIDVAFFGSNYGVRSDLIRHLRRQGIDARGYGAGWPSGFLPQEQLAALVQATRIVVSHEGVGYAYWPSHLKGKTFDFAMAGACVLTSYSSEIGDWFDINKELLCYYNFDDAVDIVTYMLRRPARLLEIGRAAHRRAISEHTWQHRFELILKEIAGLCSDA